MSVLKWSWRDGGAREDESRMVPQFQDGIAEPKTPSEPARAQSAESGVAPEEAAAPDSAIPDIFADRTWAKSWEDEIRAGDRPAPASDEIWEDDDQVWIEADTRRSRRGMRLLIAACAVGAITMGGTALAVWNAIDDDVTVATAEPATPAPGAQGADETAAPEFSAPAEKGASLAAAPESQAEPPREVRVVAAERGAPDALASDDAAPDADAFAGEGLTTGSIGGAEAPAEVAPAAPASPSGEMLAGEGDRFPEAGAGSDFSSVPPTGSAQSEVPAGQDVAAFDARGDAMEPTVGPVSPAGSVSPISPIGSASTVGSDMAPAGFPPASGVEAGLETDAAGADVAASSGTVASAVNMRAGPDNGAAVVSVLSQGSAVEVISCDLWCEVSVDGKRGYVFNSFIDNSAAGPQASR